MDYDEIKSDFLKRFGTESEKIYFLGKPLVFMQSGEAILGCCVSVGVCLAVSRRDDDRLMVEFSGKDDFLSVNTMELRIKRDNEIFETLYKAQALGAKVGGARLFFYYNTDLIVPQKELLVSALDSFCQNVPSQEVLLGGDITARVTSRAIRDCLVYQSGRVVKYLPLHSKCYKIVLSRVGGEGMGHEFLETSIEAAVEALEDRDYELFGKILNCESERILEKCENKATRMLFHAACDLGEALGSGILQDGGIFSVVRNDKVDCFVRNLSLNYRDRFGKAPDFYITDTAGGHVI